MTSGQSDTDAVESDTDAVERAIEAFARGEAVLIHDAADREGEVDIVYPADAVDADVVARLRNDAGGLVCVAVTDSVAESWGIPFLSDALDHPAATGGDLHYDQRSSFSLPVNHRETFTGITDDDRTLTITELARAAVAAEEEGYDADDFAAAFRTPGHVNLLRGAPKLLADRQGHTELALALAEVTDRAPAAVVCEMLDDETGGATTPADAQAYAERNGLVYVEGRDLLDELA